MGKYFGTDGFRGEANKNLTFEHAIKIGRFLGWYYGKRLDKKAKVVIGKDTRRSSYMFEYALCTGLRDLTTDTRIVNSRFFGNDPEAVPAQALSVGIGTVTDSKEVLVLISGHNKARAMAAVVEGGVSQKWTCSALQMHNGAIIACDEEACGELTVDTYKYFLDIERDQRL